MSSILKTEKGYDFVAGKTRYTLEKSDENDLMKLYEASSPEYTGFEFTGGMTHLISFINYLTDVAESLGEEDEIQ